MKRKFLDLKPYFNARIVYPESDDCKIHPKINEKSIVFGKNGKSKCVKFERNAELLDSVECQGQKIKLNIPKANKILIAGLCAFGSFSGDFYISFSDGRNQVVRLSCIDYTKKLDALINYDYRGDASQVKEDYNVFSEHLSGQWKAFVYYSEAEMSHNGAILSEIQFPDNILINILGITFELDK